MLTTHIESDSRGLLVDCPHCGTRNRMHYERLGQTFRCGNCHSQLSPPGDPIEIKSEAVFEGLTGHSALPVLVDFWAVWCGPCRMAEPEIAKAANEGAGRLIIGKVNVDELPNVAQRFRIQAIPTMVLFTGGSERSRKSGLMPASAILQFVGQSGG